jgi:flagellar basal-body rod modification protein FlgD
MGLTTQAISPLAAAINAATAGTTAGSATSSGSATSALGGTQGLGQDAFLKLLVTQLQNQSPLDPVQNQDFIAQLAQFSTLESSQAQNTSLTSLLSIEQLGQGAALVGKKITYTDPTSGQPTPGIVSAVALQGGTVLLNVGGKTNIPISNVVGIAGVSSS